MGGDSVDARRVERAGHHLLSACDLLLVLSHSDSVVKASTGRPESIQARPRLAAVTFMLLRMSHAYHCTMRLRFWYDTPMHHALAQATRC